MAEGFELQTGLAPLLLIGPVIPVRHFQPDGETLQVYAMPARKVTAFAQGVGVIEVSNDVDFTTAFPVPNPTLPFDNSAPFIRFETDGTVRLVATR